LLKKVFVFAIIGGLVFCMSFYLGNLSMKHMGFRNPETGEIAIPREYKLLSADIETRNLVNPGDITKADEFFCYTFETSSGKQIHKEKQICDKYDGDYALKFQIGDENRILEYNYKSQTLLVVVMTEEMHGNVFR